MSNEELERLLADHSAAAPHPDVAEQRITALSDGIRRRLEQRTPRSVQIPGFRESAVLVPIVVSGSRPAELLFIVRHAGLPTHAGQIAFPGGKREPSDPSFEATALRETAEEIGVDSDRIRVCGRLDDVPTPAGFVITPVVAVVQGPLSLSPNQAEVADHFAAPVTQLPSLYHNAGEREWNGFRYLMHEFHYPDSGQKRRIWGATAVIVRQFLDELLRR